MISTKKVSPSSFPVGGGVREPMLTYDGVRPVRPSEIKTYRLSDDAMMPNLRLILDVVPGMVTLYEADMTSRRAEAQETEVHDKILMSPADARWLRDALNSADLSDPPGWNAPGGAK